MTYATLRRSSARIPVAVRLTAAALGLLLGATACTASGPLGAPPSGGPASAALAPTAEPSGAEPSPLPASPAVSEAALIEPPAAELRSAAGVSVGALGSFSFRETGQSAPWLPGTPVALPAGAAVEVGLAPDLPVDSWTASVVPSTDLQDTSAVALGEGTGPIRFEAPAAGSWSVMVAVRFGDGLGSASYFWALTAR